LRAVLRRSMAAAAVQAATANALPQLLAADQGGDKGFPDNLCLPAYRKGSQELAAKLGDANMGLD